MENQTLNNDNYTRTLKFKTSPEIIFQAFIVAEEIGKWWDTPSGNPEIEGNIIHFDFDPTHWDMKILELVPNKKIIWQCVMSNIIVEGFPIEEANDWEGTELIWEIKEIKNATEVTFVHSGLNPSKACYNMCSAGWDYYFVENFEKYINSIENQNA